MFSYLYELPSYVYVFVIRIAFLGMFLVYVCLSAIMFACQYFSLSFHIFVLYALQFTDAGLPSLLGLFHFFFMSQKYATLSFHSYFHVSFLYIVTPSPFPHSFILFHSASVCCILPHSASFCPILFPFWPILANFG